MNYQEALGWLYATQLHGIKLGLAPMRDLLRALEVDVQFPPETRVFHVAGTNGKGSVCAMIDAICRAAGHRTGLFISPHLVTCRERIQINGQPISEADFASGMTRIRRIVEGWPQSPTFFEIITALALAHFKQAKAAAIVLETGMGGRLDATNVIDPTVCVITAIGFDHKQWLGDTLAAIAGEKAGIIKPHRPVVTLPQEPEAAAVFDTVAQRQHAPLHVVTAPLQAPVNLAGSHQLWNAAAAVKAVELSGLPVDAAAYDAGLRTVQWPGRFQQVTPNLILDGAHNPPAMAQLVNTWKETHGPAKATILLSILRDKEIAEICAPLAAIAARFITVAVQNPRSTSGTELAEAVSEIHPGFEVTAAANLGEALALAQQHPETVLATGSLFLCGEILAHLQGLPLTELSAQ